MILRWWLALDQMLKGQTDWWISAMLIITAIIGIGIALWGPRPLKAGLLLYWWFP